MHACVFCALLLHIYKKHPGYNLPTESFRHGREKTSGRAFRILSFLSPSSLRIKMEPIKYAPCVQSVVHNFVGSILMRWDNEDRKDKMRNALPEVFSLPCRKLSVGRLYLGCFLKMYGSKAPKRTRAFLTHACVFVILLCDTWLPHLFHPKTVAPRFLAFAEFCMLGGASHVEAPPHLRV